LSEIPAGLRASSPGEFHLALDERQRLQILTAPALQTAGHRGAPLLMPDCRHRSTCPDTFHFRHLSNIDLPRWPSQFTMHRLNNDEICCAVASYVLATRFKSPDPK
jgi:hypothetical protein